MERFDSAPSLVTLAFVITSRLTSVVRTCRQFAVRCLKGLAQDLVTSGLHYPYRVPVSGRFPIRRAETRP